MSKFTNKIQDLLYRICGKNNKKNRDLWLEKTLSEIPSGLKILDVGAGEL